MFSSFMVNAWEAATVVAVVAGAVGFFVVLRGAAFAAHALPNGAFAGAAGAALLGVNPLAGLAAFSVLGALGIAVLGRRGRHDVATALVIVLMLGTGALFLSLTTEYSSEIFALLFGQLFGVSSSELLPTLVIGLCCVVLLTLIYRPLTYSSVLADVAEARGVSPRLADGGFLLVLALATTMAVPVVGALLIFTLLVSPAAAARCVTRRPVRALVLSIVLALITVWSAIALAYWTSLPVGFFVGAVGGTLYVGGRLAAVLAARGRLFESGPCPVA